MSANRGGSRIQHRDRNAQQKLELGTGHEARKQGISTVPETSASVPSCSLLTPSLARERIGKGEEGVRVETHLWTFQRTFHAAGVATPRKYRFSFAGIIFGGSDLMGQPGYAPSVVLVQLFVLLCCQTDQETALKSSTLPSSVIFTLAQFPDTIHLVSTEVQLEEGCWSGKV